MRLSYMKKRFIKQLFVLLVAIPLLGCSAVAIEDNNNGNENNNENTNIPVTGVSLDTNTLSLALDETYQLTTTVIPNNATNQAVSYSCNNNVVAYVDSKGKITALNEGNAKITVTTKDGNFTATCNVEVYTVSIPATGISLDKSTLTLNEGEEGQLTATVTPSNASNPRVSWSSSNANVASVSTKGLVTAKKEGIAVITAKTKDETGMQLLEQSFAWCIIIRPHLKFS